MGVSYPFSFIGRGVRNNCTRRAAPVHSHEGEILRLEEVRSILGCVRLPRYRVCLSTISSCGLRLQEGTHLQMPDIDSSGMVIHVRRGKGGKDRYVPWPQRTLERLRHYWVTHRNPIVSFPAPGRGGSYLSTATEPMPKRSVQGSPQRKQHPQTRLCSHSSALLGYPVARGWSPSSAYSRVSRTQLSPYHPRLHPPD